MTPAKLKWYAARLAAMSPAEVVHRVRELALKTAARGGRRGWHAFDAIADGPLADLSELRARLAAAAPLTGPAIAELEAGRLHGLGQSLPRSAGWFADPVSGKPWPGAEAYCFDIDVRTTGQGKGDVKYVWELNRLQMLHPLAARIAAGARPADIDLAFDVLESWAGANPPYRGVNWFSGIELAMRMVTVTLLVAAIPPAALSSGRRLFLRRFIAAHALWLARYPSKFSSANNHLVAEGLGLFLAGLIAPDLPHARDHLAEGRAILEQETLLQIFEDGVGAEQSPTYQAFTMEMVAFAALAGSGLGQPLSRATVERLVAGAAFLRSMMDASGRVPQIGDDDEGRVLAMPPDREPRYVASVVAAVAGLAGLPDLAPPHRDAHLRDALFAAPPAANAFGTGVKTHRAGGYTVAREEVAGRLAVLTFDHGPLGYLKLAAHGHADALSVWLSVDEAPVIVDAGTFLYHSGGVMRNRLRASMAHNTLTIGGASQSIPSSAFSWSLRTDARLVETRDGAWWSVTGAHEGYRRRYGVTHARTVARTPEGFSITDRLEGATGPLDAAIGFLVAPDLEIDRAGDRFRLSRAGIPVAEIVPPAGLRAHVVRDDRETGAGLHSPAFGLLVAARRITFSGALGPDPVLTRIVILPAP